MTREAMYNFMHMSDSLPYEVRNARLLYYISQLGNQSSFEARRMLMYGECAEYDWDSEICGPYSWDKYKYAISEKVEDGDSYYYQFGLSVKFDKLLKRYGNWVENEQVDWILEDVKRLELFPCTTKDKDKDFSGFMWMYGIHMNQYEEKWYDRFLKCETITEEDRDWLRSKVGGLDRDYTGEDIRHINALRRRIVGTDFHEVDAKLYGVSAIKVGLGEHKYLTDYEKLLLEADKLIEQAYNLPEGVYATRNERAEKFWVDGILYFVPGALKSRLLSRKKLNAEDMKKLQFFAGYRNQYMILSNAIPEIETYAMAIKSAPWEVMSYMWQDRNVREFHPADVLNMLSEIQFATEECCGGDDYVNRQVTYWQTTEELAENYVTGYNGMHEVLARQYRKYYCMYRSLVSEPKCEYSRDEYLFRLLYDIPDSYHVNETPETLHKWRKQLESMLNREEIYTLEVWGYNMCHAGYIKDYHPSAGIHNLDWINFVAQHDDVTSVLEYGFPDLVDNYRWQLVHDLTGLSRNMFSTTTVKRLVDEVCKCYNDPDAAKEMCGSFLEDRVNCVLRNYPRRTLSSLYMGQ